MRVYPKCKPAIVGEPRARRLQRADEPAVAAMVAGAAHRRAKWRETLLAIQRLRRVHAGEGFKIATLESEFARRIQAARDHCLARSEPACLGQEIHLAQFAHIGLAV